MNLVILCHDVFVQYQGGILLVNRLKFPAKGILWPLGGRIKRGMSMEDSLREKVLEESGLELEGLIELGQARAYFRTDPFGHGKGTDTINFVYFGVGKGELKLDKFHEEPMIITPKEYNKYRGELHPYVMDFMDEAIKLAN
ncbi:MAG: NUDIX hydrolase [Nanoarchaeota archaeon]